ncbi:DUF4112 domain-containing protein [Sandarakinorhabdus sp.]|uniref:DUF4112 domain-containing protein n=1 Tax=Sandarakinorhabdus sp. TaxID=1916663 RepID=UPI003563C978
MNQARFNAVTARLPRTDAASALVRIERLERLLEGAIRIPGLSRRIGLDAIIGLVPGVGDAASAVMGLYVVWEARNLGLPRFTLLRMIGNVGVDAVIGSVPVAGDLFDFFFRSNTRNLKLLRRHLTRAAT